jgi:hypothetical protein
MRRYAPILIALMLAAGCGGSGGGVPSVDAELQELNACARATLISLARMAHHFGTLLRIAQGEPQSSDIDFFFGDDPVSPTPDDFEFGIAFDTDGDSLLDTSITGRVVFSEDPTDGLSPGATVDISFQVWNDGMLSGFGGFETGTFTASGSVWMTIVSPTEVRIGKRPSGVWSLLSVSQVFDECGVTMLVRDPDTLTVRFDEPILSGGASVQVRGFGVELSGAMEVQQERPVPFYGSFSLDASQSVRILGNMNGSDIDTRIDVLLPP